MAHDVPLTKPLVDNDAVVTTPPEIVRPPLPVTKPMEVNPAIVDIAPLTIKPSVLVTTILEVKPAKVETAPLIVAPDAPLARPIAENADMVATLQILLDFNSCY